MPVEKQDTEYTMAEIKAAQKALRLLYDELNAKYLLLGEHGDTYWIKEYFHKHMNKYSSILKSLEDKDKIEKAKQVTSQQY